VWHARVIVGADWTFDEVRPLPIPLPPNANDAHFFLLNR
jgi:hypothetical protein